MQIKYILLVVLSIFLSNTGFLQAQTKVRGIVQNKIDKEFIPFAAVSFKNTSIGTVTDYKGVFFIESKTNQDSLIISSLGYKTDTIVLKKGSFQEIMIFMEPESYGIDEVVVLPGENPAHRILNKIIKNKSLNNPEKFDSYSFEQYTKLQADLNNFDPRIKNEKFMKDFAIVFDGIDTSSVTGKIYVPLVLFETLSDFYYQKFPRNKKEIIKAMKTSGVQNTSASQFSGQMYVELNFYDNYMNIFEKQFVSPISFNALMVYKYYLIDSTFIDNNWCYHITYKPKRKNEYTFSGDFWVADTSFALKSINANMSETANIEFISSMYIKHEFDDIADSVWFPISETLFVDFNVTQKTAGFFGRKFVSRKNIQTNVNFPNKFFSPVKTREIIVNDDIFKYDSAFWDQNRHARLNPKESAIYKMVDSVKSTPKFKTIEKFVYLLSTGYFKKGKIEIGPYYNMYSKNVIEGPRFRIGGRTSNKFSEKLEISGHVAFGLLDQKLKYGSQLMYKIDKKPWTMLKVFYQNDMVQLAQSAGAFGTDNIFSSALSTTPNDKLLPVTTYEIGVERDIFPGLITNLFFAKRDFFSTDSVIFIDNEGFLRDKLSVSELNFNIHFGYNQEIVSANFNRLIMGSLYPIFEIGFTHGFDNLWGGEYKYNKITAAVKHYAIFGPLGKFKYYIEAGKIFGKVPFPLLKLHEGNQTYLLDNYAFNMMKYYEFASDEYLSVFVEHHFQGLVLNKIPLLRKLHFREVIFAKGVIGSLSEQNKTEFAFPGALSGVQKPYIEGGVGIENILKFLRVDAVWRFTHLENPNTARLGIRVGMQVSF